MCTEEIIIISLFSQLFPPISSCSYILDAQNYQFGESVEFLLMSDGILMFSCFVIYILILFYFCKPYKARSICNNQQQNKEL